jgi:hypothetical protein
MARAERKKLIEDLQTKRGGRLCVAYITSTRPQLEIQIADDVLRLLYDHLEKGAEAAKKGVDLFIHSNGGSGTVPWRVVSLIREYTDKFAVLVPHRAFSAATLIALGADEIVMHKMGCLGPIDPSVANPFNPPHPQNPGVPLAISVEDVSAYFKMISEELGISHEDELIQAVLALTEKVHPLALGNVQRSHNQARMMARKLLKRHMPTEAHEHEITKIIDTLKSNLFFHGHPINRQEAEQDLKLKVTKPPPEIEALMWELYVDYEKACQMTENFDALHEIDTKTKAAAAPAPPTTAQLVQQIGQLAQQGLNLQQVTEEQLVKLAAAMLPIVTGVTAAGGAKIRLDGLRGAYVESSARADVFKLDLAVERAKVGQQDVVKQEVLWRRWEEEK